MKLFSTCLVCLLSTCINAQSGPFIWSGEQSVAPSSFSNLRPRLASDQNGEAVVLWGSSGAQANYVTVGGAAGFSTPEQITPAGMGLFVDSWIGSELASNGTSVWATVFGVNAGEWSVYGIGSFDGGLTWTDTVRASPLSNTALYPTVDVGPNGPIIMYMEHDPGFAAPRYVTAKSSNGGGSFDAPVQLSSPYAPGEVCDCCPANIEVNGNEVFAMFRNNDHNQRDMYIGWSTNGGSSYSGAIDVEPGSWQLFGCPSSGASSMVFGDSLRYVWMTGSSGTSRVFMGTMHRITKQVGHTAMVYADPNGSASQNYPVIAGTGNEFMIAWEYGTSGDKDIQFAYSTSGTAGLSVPQILNSSFSGLQTKPDLEYSDGTYHVVWSDGATGEVKYRAAVLAVDLDVKVLLDGPFDGVSLMSDMLRANGHIPVLEPFTALGFTHVGEGGGESIDPSVLVATGNDAIVDWVMVELRDKNNNTSVLATRSALLQRDGTIVDLDGTSHVRFGVPSDDYFLVVKHRNHAAVMKASTIALNTSTPAHIDFSLLSTATYGTNAQRNKNGTMVLWAGNVNSDHRISYTGANNDRDLILVHIGGSVPTATAVGYAVEDANMDGTTKYTGLNNDRDLILVNIGGSVPTAVVPVQLP